MLTSEQYPLVIGTSRNYHLFFSWSTHEYHPLYKLFAFVSTFSGFCFNCSLHLEICPMCRTAILVRVEVSKSRTVSESAEESTDRQT